MNNLMNGRRRLYRNTPELRLRVRELMDRANASNAHHVARLSQGKLRFQTIHNLITGTVENVQVSTLERLAETLSTTFEDLAEQCRPSEVGPWTWPPIFDDVPKDVRLAWERSTLTIFRQSGIVPPG